MITVHIPKIIIKIFLLFSLMYIRMSGKSVSFNDKKIKRSDFYKNKKVFQIDNTEANKTLVSKEKPYGTQNSFKYFIG